MPTEAQTLFELAKCYECYGSLSLAQMLRLGILQQIVLNSDPMADVSAQTLMELGSCYNCYGDGLSAAEIMELALLSMVAANGTGGGGTGGGASFGPVDPNGVVNATVVGQIYRNNVTGTVWQAEALGNANWVQFL